MKQLHTGFIFDFLIALGTKHNKQSALVSSGVDVTNVAKAATETDVIKRVKLPQLQNQERSAPLICTIGKDEILKRKAVSENINKKSVVQTVAYELTQ